MKDSISIYISPYASQVDKKSLETNLQKFFFRNTIEIKSPDGLDLLTEELKKDVKNKSSTIICVGGDGTINKILSEVHPAPLSILVVPRGTANDLANELGLSKKIADLKKCVQYQTTKMIDVLDVNGVPFLTHGGIGIGADLCEMVNTKRTKSKLMFDLMKKLKADSYGLQLGRLLLTKKFKTYKLKLNAPHLPKEGLIIRTPLLTISNQERIAGSLQIAPYTKNDDGQFSVSLFLSKSNTDILMKFLKLRQGENLLNELSFTQFETPEITIENLSEEPIAFYGDGEILLKNKIFNLTVRDKKQSFYFYDEAVNYNTAYNLKEVTKL